MSAVLKTKRALTTGVLIGILEYNRWHNILVLIQEQSIWHLTCRIAFRWEA